MAVPIEARQFSPRVFIMITKEDDKKKLEELFDRLHIPICYQVRGKGTATSEMLDIFGLSGSTRLITAGILPKIAIEYLMKAAEALFSFHKKGGGIVLTVPLIGMQHPVFQVLSNEEKEMLEQKIQERMENMEEMKHQSYVVVWVSVVSGYSDEVIDAARKVGAKGGTVLRGRQRNSERVSEWIGISTQEERDFVMMVVPRDKKREIMAAIGDACGLSTKARGVILALPVDDVFGLEE